MITSTSLVHPLSSGELGIIQSVLFDTLFRKEGNKITTHNMSIKETKFYYLPEIGNLLQIIFENIQYFCSLMDKVRAYYK
jgi:hypothetical protein